MTLLDKNPDDIVEMMKDRLLDSPIDLVKYILLSCDLKPIIVLGVIIFGKRAEVKIPNLAARDPV